MDIMEAIHQHRSIRKYKPNPVPLSVISEDCSLRLYQSLHVRQHADILNNHHTDQPCEQLYIPHKEQSMVLNTPALITFCADFNRMRKSLKLKSSPDNFDNFMSFMITAIDATLVSQNVALAAEQKGWVFVTWAAPWPIVTRSGRFSNYPKVYACGRVFTRLS